LEIYGVKNIVGIPFGYRGFFEKGLKEIPVRMLSIFSQALKGLIFITSLDHCGEVSLVFLVEELKLVTL
jgi:hypothetical protein